MGIVANQRRIARALLQRLRPHWREDAALAARIERLLKDDRRLGARDRRLYRELAYTALRYLSWIEPWLDPAPDLADEALAWLAAELPSTRGYRAEVLAERGWPPCPMAVESRRRELEAMAARTLGTAVPLPSLLPAWAESDCPVALEPAEYELLHRRAPLWIRLQADDGGDAALKEFTARGWTWRASEMLAGAARIDGEVNLADTAAFQSGQCEVQDLGSQLVLASAAVGPGGRWLDACAGAGGKALQLARMLGPDGQVDVHDVRPQTLAELGQRAARAGLTSRIRRPDRLGGHYDGVLVDAPCSGSGTWRRAPQLKWTTTPERIETAAELQVSLLAQFGFHVRPGGRLLYATCSLCPRENQEVAARFLATQRAFVAEPPARPFRGRPAGAGLLFTPSGHDGDGFFVASFRRQD